MRVILKIIRSWLPNRFKEFCWKKLYNMMEDGCSYVSFYAKLAGKGPTLMILKDSHHHIFGGFISESWRPVDIFYGTGECFVFTVKPLPAKYEWTHKNDLFIFSKNSIIMGGGGGGAFTLDSEFYHGMSQVSKTFLNKRLSHDEEFVCNVLEVWGFERAII